MSFLVNAIPSCCRFLINVYSISANDSIGFKYWAESREVVNLRQSENVSSKVTVFNHKLPVY